MTAFPCLFVSHGAPTLALDAGPTKTFLGELGARLGKPAAVLCVSAHWDTPQPRLTGTASPATIHDFYGFPEILYTLQYPAPGAPELAARTAALLAAAGYPAEIDPEHGLDHGAWVPLSLMYPDADVPVIQLSLQSRGGPRHHLELGRALAPLREEGVLIMGSGGVTHNLMDLRPRQTPPADYAVAFDGWLGAAVSEGLIDDLLDYRTRAEHARRAHPSEEHLLPLFVPLGAADGGTGEVIHRAFDYGALSLAAYAWN